MKRNNIIQFIMYFLLYSLFTTQTLLPQHVRISGLPFKSCGWNNEFILENDGRYVMSHYMLYDIVPIAGAYLKHTSNPECEYNPSVLSCKLGGSFHGRWHMFRSDGLFFAYKDDVGSSPVGIWKDKYNNIFTVSDDNSSILKDK